MRPRPPRLALLLAVLGLLVAPIAAYAVVRGVPSESVNNHSDLTEPTGPVTAVSYGGSFFGHCSSGDSCQGPTGHQATLEAPDGRSGTAILTATYEYRTQGRGRFHLTIDTPAGVKPAYRVRRLRPAPEWQTSTNQIVITGLPTGQPVDVTIYGSLSAKQDDAVSIGGRRLVVRVDYL